MASSCREGLLWRVGLLSLGQLGLASHSLAARVSGFCSLGLDLLKPLASSILNHASFILSHFLAWA
jgi:hypothetical protein